MWLTWRGHSEVHPNHTHTHTHTHTQTHAYVPTRAHVCAHKHVHTRTYMHTQTHRHMHVCTHTYGCLPGEGKERQTGPGGDSGSRLPPLGHRLLRPIPDSAVPQMWPLQLRGGRAAWALQLTSPRGSRGPAVCNEVWRMERARQC